MDYVQYISHHCQENWPWIDEIIYTPQSHPQVGIGGYIFSTMVITNHHQGQLASLGALAAIQIRMRSFVYKQINTTYSVHCVKKNLVGADVGRGGPLDGKMYLNRYDHKKTNRNDQLDSMK